MMSYTSNESWSILSPIEQSIKKKIEAVGTPLKNWDININYGIKTGYNEAFIISTQKKNELIAQDPKSAEIIRPILRGRDIKRYSAQFADLWLLFIPWHFPLHLDSSIRGASEKAEQIFKEQYPAIYQHLLSFKSQLEKRNSSETGIRYEWYALQRWGAKYWDDFDKQKIIFQEMVQTPSFMLDTDEHFLCLDTGRIIVGKNIKYLLALMNSDLFFFAIKYFYGGGSLGGTGVRMKHTFFEKFNAIIPDENTLSKIEEIVDDIITHKDVDDKNNNILNNIINNMYGLSENEINYISSTTFSM